MSHFSTSIDLCITWPGNTEILKVCFEMSDIMKLYILSMLQIWNWLRPITRQILIYSTIVFIVLSLLFSSSKIKNRKNLIIDLQPISNLARVIVTLKDRSTINCWCSTAQTRKHKIFLSHARTEKAPFSSLTWPKKILCRSIESASRRTMFSQPCHNTNIVCNICPQPSMLIGY